MKLNTRKMAALFAAVFTTFIVGMEALLNIQMSFAAVFVTAFLTATTVTTILIMNGQVAIELSEETE